MINITTLENGFRIGTDTMVDVETIAVCLAVKVGSRFEDMPEQGGISHFLEHMAFKGTLTRTALEIAKEIESVGGFMNAYTSKEVTVFYIVALKEHLELAINILADILQNSTFKEEEIEKERGVILQELASYKDIPDEVAFDKYYETLFAEQPIGRPIIGTEGTINSFKKADFENYIGTKYNAGNMVLSVSGKLEHAKVVELASRFFTKLNKKQEVKHNKAEYTGGEVILKNKELMQVQYIVGFKAFDMYNEKSYQVKIASSIMGGGMSSRLFQEIREKRGLVYTVSSFDTTFTDNGIFGVYAGTHAKDIAELSKVLKEEFGKITQNIEEEEMHKTITQVKASLLMSQESTIGRAKYLASCLLFRDKFVPHSEVIARYEKITPAEIKTTMEEVFSSKETLVIYGNV